VLPPLVGGLHCGGLVQPFPGIVSWHVLPPLVGGLHCGISAQFWASSGTRMCSRRSSAGSIAAAKVTVTWDQPGECSRRSSAGSIAAHRQGWHDVTSKWVLPPLVGGLHCGQVPYAVGEGGAIVLPPLFGGLHCGDPMWQGLVNGAKSAPAAVRRAPLRQRGRVRDAEPGGLVLPPLVGGLHCGP